MKKIRSFALVAVAALALTACGGGGDDASSAGTGAGPGTGTETGNGPGTGPGTKTGVAGTPTAPVNAVFTMHNYLQNLYSSGVSTLYREIGVGAAGSLVYGATGAAISMTPQSDGSIIYGAPITQSMAVGDNPHLANLPSIAMLCQAAAVGDGTDGRKSTDVLVNSQAIRISYATELANQVFSIAREDCSPAVAGTTLTLSFDAQGNATVKDGSNTTTHTAAAMSNAMVGNAPLDIGKDGYVVFYAYSYKKADGGTVYAVVEHGGPSANTTGLLPRGYVMLWSQE